MTFEIFVLATYFTALSIFFTKTLSYLSHDIDYDGVETYDLIKDMSCIDKNNNTYKKFTNFCKKFEINTDDNILIKVDGDSNSMVLLNLAYSYFENTENIGVVYFNDSTFNSKEKSDDLKTFCDYHNLTYFNCKIPESTDILQKNMNRFNAKFFNSTLDNLTKEFNTSHVFGSDSFYDNSIYILSSILNGDRLSEFQENVEINDNYNLYKPLYNIKRKEILNICSDYKTPFLTEDNNSMDRNYILSDFVRNIEVIYPDWETNLYRTYRTNVGFEKVLQNSYNDLTETSIKFNKFKYGLVIETRNDYIPYDYWKKSLAKYFTCSDNEIAKIYFMFNTSEIEVLGELNDEYLFYYINGKIIIYHKQNIQNYFNNTEINYFENSDSNDFSFEEEFEPSLEKILNGEDIKYTSFNTLLDFNIPESILTNLKINTGKNVSFEYCLFHIKNNQLE
jgi:tRNA(Ile)-lysidine synthase TilS/MesJ